MTQETYFTVQIKEKNGWGGKQVKTWGKTVENEENFSHNGTGIPQRRGFLIRNKCGDELEWL